MRAGIVVGRGSDGRVVIEISDVLTFTIAAEDAWPFAKALVQAAAEESDGEAAPDG